MSVLQIAGASNPYSATHSLADATAVTVTFPGPVSAVRISTESDAKFTAKFGTAAPTTPGTNSTPVAGFDLLCPAYGTTIIQTSRGYLSTTLGLYNLSGATVVFHVEGWCAAIT